MGRRFNLIGRNLTMGTGSVLAALQAATAGNAGSIIEIERVEISQNGTTTSAQLDIALSSRDTTGTLTVTSATPAPLVFGAPVSGITGGTSPLTAAKCGVASSADSGGAYVDTDYCSPNNLGGYLWQPIPQHTLILPPGLVFVVRFKTAPATLTGWGIKVTYHEIF